MGQLERDDVWRVRSGRVRPVRRLFKDKRKLHPHAKFGDFAFADDYVLIHDPGTGNVGQGFSGLGDAEFDCVLKAFFELAEISMVFATLMINSWWKLLGVNAQLKKSS